MRPLRLALAAALALATWASGTLVADDGAGSGSPPPGFVDTTLPNGLEVSILPDAAAPIVATQVWYHVGAANEDRGSRGLAHLFEHLMFGKTERFGSRDYADHHHRHGGYENASTSLDETVYVSDIPLEGHDRVLEMEADRMVHLVVDEDNLANEKKIVTEELRLRTENDPLSRLLVAAQKALLGDHPYAHDPGGTKEEIAAATVESARSFYAAWYHPANAHLVIVGPVDAAATLEAVRARFGPIEDRGETPADVPSLSDWKFPKSLDLEEDLPPVEIALVGVPLPPAGSADDAALDVLEQILAGSEVDPVRDELVTRRRKAVEAGAEFIRFRRGGAVILYSASLPYRRKATAFRLLDETRARLARLDWLTDESLEAAKRALLREETRRSYFASERADSIGRARWWDGDARLAFDRARRIGRVTRDDVAAAFLKYVTDPEPIRIYVRPEHVPAYVTLFGWLYPLVGR